MDRARFTLVEVTMMQSQRATQRGRPPRARWRALAGLVGLAAILAQPGLALAAAPSNDLPDGAIAIAAIPAHITQDTTEATVTTDNVGCGSDGTDQATVWYTLSLAEPASVAIDAAASGYRVGINAFAGTATAGTLIACAEQGLRLDVEPGTTYYLMFADIDGDVNGGQLDVTIDVAPPPLELTLAVDSRGKVNPRTGEATVTGTVTCSAATSDAGVDVELREAVGRFTIRGYGGSGVSCGPEPSPWAVTITGESGRFGPGRATATVFAYACDAFTCAEASASVSVRFQR